MVESFEGKGGVRMNTRGDRPTGWFKMFTAFYADAKLLTVSSGAELLFLRLVALCAGTSSGGIFTEDQARLVGHKFRSIKPLLSELARAGLISAHRAGAGRVQETRSTDAASVQDVGSPSAVSVQDVGSPGVVSVQSKRTASAVHVQDVGSPSPDSVQTYRINAFARWNMNIDESAGQRQSMQDGNRSVPTGAAPRGEKERKTERTVTSRPASPDGRDVTVSRSAPRSAEGAARNAPGVFNGAVREVGDFIGPRVAPAGGADSLAQSAQAMLRARLRKYVESTSDSGSAAPSTNGTPAGDDAP